MRGPEYLYSAVPLRQTGAWVQYARFPVNRVAEGVKHVLHEPPSPSPSPLPTCLYRADTVGDVSGLVRHLCQNGMNFSWLHPLDEIATSLHAIQGPRGAPLGRLEHFHLFLLWAFKYFQDGTHLSFEDFFQTCSGNPTTFLDHRLYDLASYAPLGPGQYFGVGIEPFVRSFRPPSYLVIVGPLSTENDHCLFNGANPPHPAPEWTLVAPLNE